MRSLPNILTMSRIAVIPVLVVLVWVGTDQLRWIALGVYTFACITDYFDGYLARILNHQSAMGRLFDPIADKLLVGACLLVLCSFGYISGLTVLPALIILLREILVSGLREYLAEIRVGLPVSRLAKWKTGLQMFSLGFLIVGNASPPEIPSVFIGEICLWLAALLTLWTGYDYLRSGLLHASAGDSDSVDD
jgi:cardiolipin synthase|tara:strand:+ start:324 stop:899 length:576 start_codon:yes stop_codon:yes gene_type:complete